MVSTDYVYSWSQQGHAIHWPSQRRILPRIIWGLLLSTQSGRSSRKPLGGASSPFLLPLRLLSHFFAEMCNGHSSPCMHVFPAYSQQLGLWLHSSINGNKLIVLQAREGAWAPGIWPLKTFPQCLLLYSQNKSKPAEEHWPAVPSVPLPMPWCL